RAARTHAGRREDDVNWQALSRSQPPGRGDRRHEGEIAGIVPAGGRAGGRGGYAAPADSEAGDRERPVAAVGEGDRLWRARGADGLAAEAERAAPAEAELALGAGVAARL